MEARCRLCAESGSDLVHVFEDVRYLELPARVLDLFEVKITIEDELPTAVCFFCCNMVEKIWAFGERVQKAQELLYQLLGAAAAAASAAEIEFVDAAKEVEVTTCFVPENLQPQSHTQPQPQPQPQIQLQAQSQPQVQPIVPQLQVHQTVLEVQVFEGNDLTLRNDVQLEKAVVGSPCLDDGGDKVCKAKVRRPAKRKPPQHHQDVASAPAPVDDGDVTADVAVPPTDDGGPGGAAGGGWTAYPWACGECRRGVAGAEEARRHAADVHGGAARWPCADCAKTYAKYSVFVAHARAHRPRLRLCCDLCGQWFRTVDQQERHRARHTDERPHVCPTCGKRFRMQSGLMVHSRSHLPAELKNRHQCDQCPKRFGTRPNLMAHKRIHAGVRDYTCDQCGKSFVQKGNLDNHLLTHTAARPFQCAHCGKAFKTAVRLRKHASVHSGLKPHRCDVCGRQFRERGTLKEHHRIHTGAMPFTCEFCGKSFRFKGVLTTHRRQHTGERPYSCHECQHHFTNWPNYNKHMKRRHGINTSVTVRKPQAIPPTGMPHRNPPGTVLAPPQPPPAPPDPYAAAAVADPHSASPPAAFYPVLSLYGLPEELLQQRV